MKKLLLILFIISIPAICFSADCDGTKITDLTLDASPTADDITNTVDDPSGTPDDRKVPLSNILQPTEQSADPTSASATGWYRSTGSGDMFQKTDTGLWNISAGTYTPDPTTPIAQFLFESGALTTDSVGTNTLTNNNNTLADDINFKQGSASTIFDQSSSQYYNIADTSLSSDFPLKTGTSNTDFTIAFWVRPDINTADRVIVSKYDFGTVEQRSFRITARSTGAIYLSQGHTSGTAFENGSDTSVLTDGQWYHVGVTYSDTTKAYKIRIWDDTNTTNFSNVTGTFTNNISLTDADFAVGAYFSSGSASTFYNGNIDKLEIFNTVLSDSEIDARR